ncbi:hypothetical protein AOQ84DRAFT_386520 [Glonium stellatum]|uniref:Myb-like domain-containing protein n=1 Tax=Glonium stellatum TaxID=574774 RepID=A0A8E2F7T5_9PEZI|nr:hypothetical protein AOQ84DRAFT_386520 [Glonium stellatum]
MHFDQSLRQCDPLPSFSTITKSIDLDDEVHFADIPDESRATSPASSEGFTYNSQSRATSADYPLNINQLSSLKTTQTCNPTSPHTNNEPLASSYKSWSFEQQFELINTTFEDGDGWVSISSKLNTPISNCKQKYRSLFLNAGASGKWTNEEKAIIYFLRQDRFLFINIARWVPHSPAQISEMYLILLNNTWDLSQPYNLDIEFWRISPIFVANKALWEPQSQIWTPREDRILMELGHQVSLAVLSWDDVAKALSGRTPGACQRHYSYILRAKEPAWTVEEVNLLVELRNKKFLSWRVIEGYFPNRHHRLIKEFYENSELGSRA